MNGELFDKLDEKAKLEYVLQVLSKNGGMHLFEFDWAKEFIFFELNRRYNDVYTEENKKKYSWHSCHYNGVSVITYDGYRFPDGEIAWWMDRAGNVVLGRMKLDDFDHFYPNCGMDEADIIAWRYFRKGDE